MVLHLRAATVVAFASSAPSLDNDAAWVECWGRGGFDRADCCEHGTRASQAAAASSCWDSVFTRNECCSFGRARLFPNAGADRPSWEDAARWAAMNRSEAKLVADRDAARWAAMSDDRSNFHPAFSSEQRRWEVEALNSSTMLSAEVLGQRFNIWVFKRSGPAMAEVIQELQGDLYRLRHIATPEHDEVVIDAGASVGVVSILMSRLWPMVRVVAIEPAPANYRYLLWNLRMNGVAERVWPLNLALGGSPATSKIFYYSPTYPTWSQSCGTEQHCESQAKDEAWRGGWTDWQVRFEVGMVTLAEVLAALRVPQVHFLKVDCEGCEWAVLAPPSWPRLRHLVHHVAAELHRWALGDGELGPAEKAAEAAVREAICIHEKAETGNDENSVCSTA